MIPVDPPTHQLIKRVLRETPPVLNAVYEPRLRAAYETGIDGVVLVFVDYGPLALRGIVIIQEPELQLYLDYNSMLVVISTMIENAITEYDNELEQATDSTGKHHRRRVFTDE